MDKVNLGVIRNSFGVAVYNWKVHEIGAELNERSAKIITTLNIVVVSAIMATLFLQITYPLQSTWSYLGIAVTLFEIIFLVFQLSFKFHQKAIMHKTAANRYRSLREQYILLIADISNESISKKDIVAKRDRLSSEMQLVSSMSPSTSNKIYQTARIRLRDVEIKGLFFKIFESIANLFQKTSTTGEDFTISDDEIDHFLPKSLRLNKGKGFQ